MYKWTFNRIYLYNVTSELNNKCIIALFNLTFVIFTAIINLCSFISFLTTKKRLFSSIVPQCIMAGKQDRLQ